jgi:putative endonuclease
MRDRRKAERRGRGAELIAMAWLICKGYRILGRRLRTPYGEVDLAAWKRGVLAIIEVKARQSVRAGLEAVTPWQQQRLGNAALALARRWRLDAAPIRMDVLVVGPGFWPRHLRGAWFEDRSR